MPKPVITITVFRRVNKNGARGIYLKKIAIFGTQFFKDIQFFHLWII